MVAPKIPGFVQVREIARTLGQGDVLALCGIYQAVPMGGVDEMVR
jgi:hypothetical protein